MKRRKKSVNVDGKYYKLRGAKNNNPTQQNY